ncbi:hypothetical protein KDN24_06100 [Bacillus sp. Bva_UNVM-123]|uniref:hypothetical protein n=1 Tax=Bacillus sp. Bva_UNVM-123 TaxID=2829798 RepID=UPI00391F3313
MKINSNSNGFRIYCDGNVTVNENIKPSLIFKLNEAFKKKEEEIVEWANNIK